MLQEWRTRPLEEAYSFIFLDAIYYKVKEDGRYISKTFYIVLGVKVDGKKEVLGLIVVESCLTMSLLFVGRLCLFLLNPFLI
ncbi:transposase [Candidatus Acidulodesulfobacterium sp. H_13]